MEDFEDLQASYLKHYKRKRNFQCAWGIYASHETYPMYYMENPSPFPIGTTLRTDPLDSKYLFSTTATIGGEGTWGDVWSACDAVLRNARLIATGKLDKKTKIIEDFIKVSENVYAIQTHEISLCVEKEGKREKGQNGNRNANNFGMW